MELLPGFEPGTSTLPRWCSTYWAITACMKFLVIFDDFLLCLRVLAKSYQGDALPTEPYQHVLNFELFVMIFRSVFEYQPSLTKVTLYRLRYNLM